MGKIPSGILGRVSGKVGDVVGAAWKGIPYIRQYVIPGNPNTPSQQTERELFADLVSLGRTCLGSVIQPYWDPFLRKISGWARFIGVNRKLYTAHLDFSTVQISQGTLEGAIITSAIYSGSDVSFLFPATALGNGKLTDYACAFVYDEVNKVGFFDDTSQRSDTAAVVTVGAGRTIANLNAWLFFVDSKTDPTMVSYSDFATVV